MSVYLTLLEKKKKTLKSLKRCTDLKPSKLAENKIKVQEFGAEGDYHLDMVNLYLPAFLGAFLQDLI